MERTVALPKDKKNFYMQELKENGLSQYKDGKNVKERKLVKLNKSHYENIE